MVPDHFRVLSRIYRLGEKSRVTDVDRLPRGGGGGKFLEMNMCRDAIWCVLRHNFEKRYSLCTDLVASG